MPFDRTGASVRLLLDHSSPFRLLYVLQMMDCILAGNDCPILIYTLPAPLYLLTNPPDKHRLLICLFALIY